MVEQLFDFWDVDRSGTLNFQEVIDVLSKWKDISAQPQFQECKNTFELIRSLHPTNWVIEYL